MDHGWIGHRGVREGGGAQHLLSSRTHLIGQWLIQKEIEFLQQGQMFESLSNPYLHPDGVNL